MKNRRHKERESITISRHRSRIRVGSIVYRLLWVMLRPVFKLLFRFRVEGSTNLPSEPFILAPVHRSYLDTPVVAMITRRPMRFMARKSLWDIKLLGFFISFLGGFPVDRTKSDLKALRTAMNVLTNGEPLVVFPEGTCRPDTRLQRAHLRDGPMLIASRTNTPIVPVGLGGTAKALPIGSIVPRPARIVVVIGHPIYLLPKQNKQVSRKKLTTLTDVLFVELEKLYIRARTLAGEEPLRGEVTSSRTSSRRSPTELLSSSSRKLKTWLASIVRSFKRGRQP